jgi:hypothetical protein
VADQVLIESCKALLANDDFWLAAAVTDQAYEEGTRNHDFRKSRETRFSHQGGAESGAHIAPMDADLRVIVERWADLPDAVKADIVVMVGAAGGHSSSKPG